MSFIDLEKHPEFKLLQENCEAIRMSLQRATIWYEWYSDAMDAEGNCQFLEGDWTVSPVYLGIADPEEIASISDGMEQVDLLQVCDKLPEIYPEIHELMSQIPSINYAAFSKLGPRTQLTSHRHDNPDALVLHMGLQIPRHCTLNVGGAKHVWRRKGDMVIFDDTQLHSASNFSSGERIVLYVDFKKPEEKNS